MHVQIVVKPQYCFLEAAERVSTEIWYLERMNIHENCRRVRLARFAPLRFLRHALPILFLLILRKKTDCFAVYNYRDRLIRSVLQWLSKMIRGLLLSDSLLLKVTVK